MGREDDLNHASAKKFAAVPTRQHVSTDHGAVCPRYHQSVIAATNGRATAKDRLGCGCDR
eukprot:COSAG04_NODE_31371_length_257_cov_0.651899_1_plen_59_part_01